MAFTPSTVKHASPIESRSAVRAGRQRKRERPDEMAASTLASAAGEDERWLARRLGGD